MKELKKIKKFLKFEQVLYADLSIERAYQSVLTHKPSKRSLNSIDRKG